jgi:3-hydroxyacyl-CoA dehydrogenase
MTASLNIGKLAVIGAGQMGAGIAQISAAVAKIPTVYLFDPSKSQLDRQLSLIGTQSSPLTSINIYWQIKIYRKASAKVQSRRTKRQPL